MEYFCQRARWVLTKILHLNLHSCGTKWLKNAVQTLYFIMMTHRGAKRWWWRPDDVYICALHSPLSVYMCPLHPPSVANHVEKIKNGAYAELKWSFWNYNSNPNSNVVIASSLPFAAWHLHRIILHFITLHCTALHCTALHCTALHCTALQWTAMDCNGLQCIAQH